MANDAERLAEVRRGVNPNLAENTANIRKELHANLVPEVEEFCLHAPDFDDAECSKAMRQLHHKVQPVYFVAVSLEATLPYLIQEYLQNHAWKFAQRFNAICKQIRGLLALKDTVDTNGIDQCVSSIDRITSRNSESPGEMTALLMVLPAYLLPLALSHSVFEDSRRLTKELEAQAKSLTRNLSHAGDDLTNRNKTAIENLVTNKRAEFEHYAIDQRNRAHTEAVNAQTYRSEAEKVLEQTQQEGERLVAAARKAISEFTISAHAGSFREKSLRFQLQSYFWALVSLLGFVSVALAIKVLLLDHDFHTDASGEAYSTPIIITLISARVLIVSLAFYLLGILVKNFRTAQHHQEVNDQRALALMTFKSFWNSTEDQDIKDRVLLEATHLIFSPTETGYLGKSEGGPIPAIQVGDVIRQVASGKGDKSG